MSVKVVVLVFASIGGSLMKTHRIGKGRLKQIVVTRCQTLQNICKSKTFYLIEIADRTAMSPAEDHDFERINRPERNDHREVLVLAYQPFAVGVLDVEVIT